MSWFIYSLICFFGWGFADLFYKLSTDEEDSFSQYKITVWVGLVMGVCALILLPFSETSFSAGSLLVNALKYTPASLAYIISMVIGYAGLRYLELSIVSPVQNASGAFSMVAMVIFLLSTGRISSLSEEFAPLDYIGTAIIVVGVIMLAILENKYSHELPENGGAERTENSKADKYRIGGLAILFPLMYCLFDTIGTAADGIILSEDSGMNLGEIDVLILYGLTFFLAAIISWLWMYKKSGKPYNPFTIAEIRTKGVAAMFEEFGQVFYVFAMAKRPVLAAPVVASYCIASVILSRAVVKEKLHKSQYVCVVTVIVGIVILGISEGLAEL